MPKFDGSPYTQNTTPARGDLFGVMKDISETLPENQTKYAEVEDVLQFGSWASKVRAVTASGAVTLANTDPIFIEIDPNGADRDVNCPAKADDNHGYYIMHSGSANTLTIKRSGGATITTLTAGEVKYIMPSTLEDFTTLASGGGDVIGQKRLSLTSNTPVTTSDVTAATTVYWTDGTTNLSVAVPSTTVTPFDIFYDTSAGTLSAVNWTNDTTRATALVRASGRLAKSGDTGKIYLGTGRTTGVSGKCEDSDTVRFLWNYYNRVSKFMYCVDSTDSWNYTTATWRASNGNTTDGVGRNACIIGVAEDVCTAQALDTAANSTGGMNAAGGIGIDSTSANSAQTYGSRLALNVQAYLQAVYKGILSAGYHYIQHLEISEATGTTTWFGDSGAPTIRQNGMIVEIRG